MPLVLRLLVALALLPFRFALALMLAPFRAIPRVARRTYRRVGAAAGRVALVRDRRFAHPVAV